MLFTQLNLHKAKLASIDLHDKVQGRHDIALITEPYLYNNKIVGLPQGYMSVVPEIEEGSGQARAVILAPRSFNMTRLDNLCNKDCAVAQLSTQHGTLIVASVYLDINLTP